ncbi:MAG: hypothetical protein ACI3XA_03225 [Clostridia bacterium]
MENNFLDYLDSEYSNTTAKNKRIKGKYSFRLYKGIEPLCIKSNNKFVCVKMNKTKILFQQKGILTYLSDSDIVSTTMNLEPEYFDLLLSGFSKVYLSAKNELSKFEFKIDGIVFQGYGLPFVESNYSFSLHSDVDISINEFIFIINLIITKDILYGESIEDNTVYKRTMLKYKLLIEFYKLGDKKAEEYLTSMGYPIELELQEVFKTKQKTVEVNKLFANLKIE